MKTQTLIMLQEQLNKTNDLIKDYEESLHYIRNHPFEFTFEQEETCRGRLSVFNNQKLTLLDCIDWVKSVQLKDLKVKRTK